MTENTTNICPNCQHQNHEQFNFCENCGQKNQPLRITFYDFIKDFIDVIFNLDNRFWRTIKNLFIPGKLTKIFYLGKRKSYYHPLRLYIVGVILLFTILSFLKFDQVIDFGEEANFRGKYKQKQLVNAQSAIINSTIDSLKELYNDQTRSSLLDTVSKAIFLVNGSDTTYIDNEIKNDSSDFTFIFKKISLSHEEMYLRDIDELIDEKGIVSFMDRLVMKQFLKGLRDVKSFNAYLFANLTWLFLAIIPVFSLILKLFYIRRNRFYMEHFVFLLHLFTAITFMMCILLAVLIPTDNQTAYGVAAAIVLTIFPFLAFKNYYAQGFIKTFIKYCVIGIFFLFAFILTALVFFIVSAAFF